MKKKSPRVKKEKIELPIKMDVTMNDRTEMYEVISMEEALKSLKIEPNTLKTPLRIDVKYKDKSYGVLVNIPKVRILAVNQTSRALLAKQLSIGVGL